MQMMTEQSMQKLSKTEKKKPVRSDKGRNKKIPHGTAGGYTNHRCSCKRCKEAFATACYVARMRRGREVLEPGDPRHGQNGYGNYNCRCDICRAGHAETKRNERIAKRS